tara:strand:+ start:1389 stop:1853 length:465 start_codon:yes stop_codon:yes gene_type:complete
LKPAILSIFLLVFLPAGAAASDEHCLAEAMYFEARNQGWRGMLAVGVVIQNRVQDPRYPSTVCAVVRQGKYWRGVPIKNKCQFSYYCDGKPERPTEPESWEQALDLASLLLSTKLVLTGIEDATHYHTTTVKPTWATALEPRDQIGDHLFYAQR